MSRAGTARKSRAKGSVETLPSGALRVSVYAGIDPVTGQRHYLRETFEPGPRAVSDAEAARVRLVSEVAERQNPRTAATVDQLLERYLDQFDGAPNTLTLYRGYVRNHISPFLGCLRVGQVDADILDSFYAELRRCRAHCTSKKRIDHRTARLHECDDRCRPHRCRPLAKGTVRHMHFILSGAFRKAVRWRWVSISPISQAEPPSAPPPNPEPPTPAEAARILTEAWSDPAWGAQLWTTMTTGVRRGELCAIRWPRVELNPARPTVWLRTAIRKDEDGRLAEAELKTHQQRRIALDPETAEVLREHRARCEQEAAALGVELERDAYVFSPSPDGSSFAKPDSLTQRYERLAARLGIRTTIHKLRHYSATELILGGVDVRTVAGRLGHGGGGTTTLRTYTAWVSEADQRAAAGLGAGMPARPRIDDTGVGSRSGPRHPYELVAAAVEARIARGDLAAGSPLPTAADLAATHGVSLATARRAVLLLKTRGLVAVKGARPVVRSPRGLLAGAGASAPAAVAENATAAAGRWTVTLRGPGGRRYPPRVVSGRLDRLDSFRSHLVGIARMENPELSGGDDSWVSSYELELVPVDESSAPPLVLRW